MSFGADAARYDRTRPTYPSALVDDLTRSEDQDVLDVGCGTGIAARLFLARGRRVLGLEPDPRMAAFARSTGLDVEEGRIEEWEPLGRKFDLVISAQAWHWVDPGAGALKVASVLRPSGRVGLFWNVARHEPSIQSAFDEQYRLLGLELDQHSVVLGRGGDDRFPLALEGLRRAGDFHDVERREYHWQKRYTTAAWTDHLPTHSDHASLPEDRLAALLERIGKVIDDGGGSFEVTYRTVLVTGVRS
jgi:SAM-dependent methyltransferase